MHEMAPPHNHDVALGERRRSRVKTWLPASVGLGVAAALVVIWTPQATQFLTSNSVNANVTASLNGIPSNQSAVATSPAADDPTSTSAPIGVRVVRVDRGTSEPLMENVTGAGEVTVTPRFTTIPKGAALVAKSLRLEAPLDPPVGTTYVHAPGGALSVYLGDVVIATATVSGDQIILRSERSGTPLSVRLSATQDDSLSGLNSVEILLTVK